MKKKKYLWSLITFVMVTMLSIVSTSCGGDDSSSEPDRVSVSLPSVNFGESGGSQSIQVTSNTKWTVSGNPGWLTVTPMQGSNNGAFSLTATTNPDKSSRNCILYISAGDASAMVSVTQSGKQQATRVNISNNSTYTLERFTVHFINSRLEELSSRDFGTLYPGGSISVDIPTGATEYYMATYLGSRWYFSANYAVEYTDMNLTAAEVGNWSANSSASRYPQASSVN